VESGNGEVAQSASSVDVCAFDGVPTLRIGWKPS
jgi:hypothetical protein